MNVIHKYSIAIGRPQTIKLPRGATVLKFSLQRNVPTIWVLVDTSLPEEDRIFAVIGTEWEIMTPMDYIDTAFEQGSGLVWHCLEVV